MSKEKAKPEKKGIEARLYRRFTRKMASGEYTYDVDALVFISCYEVLQELEENQKQRASEEKTRY